MKLIIENRSDLDELTCLEVVRRVVENGRISNNGKQYCYLATFDVEGVGYVIATDLNKKSDKFTIYKDTQK